MYDPKLDTFVQVAELGSFSKAAQALYITPTSVIQQMNKLEDLLEVRLFNRSSTGVSLTEHGKALQAEAPKIFAASKRLAQKVEAAKHEATYVLRIGTSLLQPHQDLLRIWRLVETFATDSFEFHAVPFNDSEQEVSRILLQLGEDIDVIFALEGDFWFDRCSMFPIQSTRYCLLVPDSLPLSRKDSISPADIRGCKVMVGKGAGPESALEPIRTELARTGGIEIVPGPEAYDMSTFEMCAAAETAMVVPECWEEVHPNMQPVRVHGWNQTVMRCLMFSPTAGENVQKFVSAFETARNRGMLPKLEGGRYA